jgi:hypothetical protein
MLLTEAIVIPETPEYRGVWGWDVSGYASLLQTIMNKRLDEATTARAHWRITDGLRHAIDIIKDAREARDHELIFICGDWILRGAPAVALRDTVVLLRAHHDGAVRHLVTAARIDACQQIPGGLTHRGRTNWENNRECAYLAFDDPTLVPKIMFLIEQGRFAFEDIRDHLPLLEGIPLALADGAL